MKFSHPAVDIIRRRCSVRTYKPLPLEAGLKSQIEHLLSQPHETIFHHPVRLQLVEKAYAKKEKIRLGTYGFISGTGAFIAGAVHSGEKCCVDYGYIMEKAILQLTDWGLGTCWLGGSLTRDAFGRALRLSENEVIPCVTPVGYPTAHRSLRDKLIRWSAGSKNRQPWSELFFKGAFAAPLAENEAGPFALPLEMVRLGPSASNRQPWRAVYGPARNRCDFYLRRTPGYKRFAPGVDLQMVDMGIALAHFELAAREANLPGNWNTVDPHLSGNPGWEYIASWA